MPTISTSACSARAILLRDCQRLINQDRNLFAACMVALGDADGMVTGVTRNYSTALDDVRRVIDPKPGHRVIGVSIVLARGRTVLVADTAVTRCRTPRSSPTSPMRGRRRRAPPGLRAARRLARLLDLRQSAGRALRARAGGGRILDKRRVDFEYDGEMAADVALNPSAMAHYPFCRLSGPANVLVMPAFHSASISTKLLQELGGATVIGPLLVGLDKPVQIVLARRQGQRHRQHGGARGVQCQRLTSTHARPQAACDAIGLADVLPHSPRVAWRRAERCCAARR